MTARKGDAAEGERRLARELRDRFFGGGREVEAGQGPTRIGAELEVIPVDRESRRVARLGGEGPRTTMAMMRALGVRHEWTERRTERGTPAFALAGGVTITFEPGGQIELVAPPAHSITALLDGARAVLDAVRTGADSAGIDLLEIGIDPVNPVSDAPLQLGVDRYCRMAEYFESIGSAGARMMRQTAALQIGIDAGADPARRWRLLNALAPYVVALFANSPRYAGVDSGHASFRAACWRALDPARTGLLSGDDPGDTYARFALAAPAMMHRNAGGEYRPFADWLASGEATRADWETHLTTLFPEVRPHEGYFELRSCDALPAEQWAAPLVFVAGLAYHGPSTLAALELLGEPDPDALARAGRVGMGDRAIARTAGELVTLALAGARALGPEMVGERDLDAAKYWLGRLSGARRSGARSPRTASDPPAPRESLPLPGRS